MINRTEIAEIKDAIRNNTLLNLLDKWETELYAKELTKAGAIEVTLYKDNKADEIKVTATAFGQSFAFHKAAWGAKGYTLTHINSGLSAMTGAKAKVQAVMKELSETEWFKGFDESMKTFSTGFTPPQYFNDFAEIIRKAR